MTARLVYLLDVDNTLLDNDRFKSDLEREIARLVPRERAGHFWELYEEVRGASGGVVDFPETLRQFRRRFPDEPHGEDVDRAVLGVPFRRYLFPGALDLIARLWAAAEPAILSDGDRVYQPMKIERAGLLLAVRGNVLVYEHKEDHLAEVLRRFPADAYVHVDDKAALLARTKLALGTRVTTVHVRQGHYASEPPDGPPPDVVVDRIANVASLRSGSSSRTPLARSIGGGAEMPQEAWTDKRERQYDHIKTNLEKRGRSEDTAERIAAATVNQTRTAKGETKEPKAPSERAQARRDMSAAGRKGARAKKSR